MSKINPLQKDTPRYIGYHERLPIRAGQKIVIPRSTLVYTMHPQRDAYLTSRAQQIIVHHTLPGQSISYSMIGEKEAWQYGLDYPELMKLRDERLAEWYKGYHPVMNPRICWAGTGGYWCEVDINAVLPTDDVAQSAAC